MFSAYSAKEGSYEEGTSDDETDSILPDIPSNSSNVFKHLVSNVCLFCYVYYMIDYLQISSSESPGSNAVLANHPDITLIKKEKSDAGSVNNNSDHSESSSDK